MDFYLQQLHDGIAGAIAGLGDRQLAWHPEGKWSAAEVLEHLYLTYTGTVKGFERCLSAAKPLASVPSAKQRVQSFIVTGLGYFPRGRTSPKVAIPRGLPQEQVVPDIGAQIRQMDELIRRAEDQFGRNTWVLDHPVLGPLTAHQWRKFHLVHGRHHIKQIARLRSQVPKSSI